ncbi:MAG: aldo/keto reductase [Lachnospiraceae bacterium]|nr:aldo/keto reductase [Lachnospiraceae bacterium]
MTYENPKKLGFGTMRLPMKSTMEEGNIDIEEFGRMVDVFLERGFIYFDTAYAYGNAELAVKEALVKRHPRESYTLASKMPTFLLQEASQLEQIFNEQLERCGVTYFDYYLMHDLSRNTYPTAQQTASFEFISQKKKEGKIKNIGFSFHDQACVLDLILTEHPEVDFVQLMINYLDWSNAAIQSRLCYETALKHGKKVVIMEPVKGGSLVNLPEDIAAPLKAFHPDLSIPSWAIRFAASLDQVLVVLSGMSNMEQMLDNTSYMEHFEPLSEQEQELVAQTANQLVEKFKIPCDGCGECTKNCPKNISIPEYFALYNAEQVDVNKGRGAQLDYFATLLFHQGKPSECIDCGKCEAACPKQLHIVENLKKVEQEMEAPTMQMMAAMMGGN